MSDFEEKLNSILSNPEEMEKISRLASQLMGNEAPDNEKSSRAPRESSDNAKSSDFPDPEMLRRLGEMLGGARNDKTALLSAIGPYMSPARRAKLEKAMKFARLAKVAGTVFAELGSDNGG